MTALVVRGDARRLPLPDASVDLIVTSPPYFALRSYQDGGQHYAGQVGSEGTPAEFIAALLECTREWMRVLKPSGSIWVNLGDKYASQGGAQVQGLNGQMAGRGIVHKSLCGIPWRYALGCIDQLGLILRAEVVWSKPNGLPESVTDRVRRSHEQWFHLVKQPRYFSAIDEIREPYAPSSIPRRGRGRDHVYDAPGQSRHNGLVDGHNVLGALPGSVWTIPTEPLTVPDHLSVAHFAAFPTEWPRRLILGWSPSGICVDCGFLLGSSYDSGMLGVPSELRRSRAQGSARDVLQQDLLQPAYGEKPEDDEVPQTDDTRIRGDLEARSSDGAEERLHDGAPLHHGGAPRATAQAVRGGASPQRAQDRQPDRELGTAGQGRARPAAQTTAQALRLPTLRRHGADLRNAQPCPNCGGSDFRPSVVADVFGGTGTTALVASVLGRVGISVDLSHDYSRLARWRTTDPAQRARAMRVDKPPIEVVGQVALFDGAAS